MIKWSDLKCTHSVVLSKEGKHFVTVLFERGNDSAEGTVPDCVILRSIGFDEEEIEELEEYLRKNRKDIIEAAKSITNLKKLFS